MTVQHREPGSAHRDQANRVYQRILGTSAARGRHIALGSGRRTHVVEVGDGPPVVFLHGTSTSSLSFLTRDVRGADGERCLLERLDGMRAIAVDRPGFGLSDPVPVPRERFRDGAVGFVDEILDKLGLETCALAGSSMGGTWALWYALANPARVRRLVLLGAAPLLPGTRPPVAPRLMSAPVIGDLLTRVVKPDARMAVRLLSAMGEKDTDRPPPGSGRGRRRRRQRSGCLGGEPRRTPSDHLPGRLPTVVATAPRRAAAADRPDLADLG